MVLEHIPEDREASPKRVPPPFIKKVLDYDAELTKKFSHFMEQNLPISLTKSETKFMEVSCSGFIWLPICVVMFLLHPTFSRQSAVNLLLGLLTDIVIVAIVKAFARRRRPPSKKNDYFKSIGVDRYSFPSGHASRSVLLAIMYTQFSPLFDEWILQTLCYILLWGWSISVCASRLLNGRHYLLDVTAGIIFGFAESYVVQYFWRSPEQADNLFNSFNEDVPEL